jgi:hypothetical protein
MNKIVICFQWRNDLFLIGRGAMNGVLRAFWTCVRGISLVLVRRKNAHCAVPKGWTRTLAHTLRLFQRRSEFYCPPKCQSVNKVALENSKGLLQDVKRAQFSQSLRAFPFGLTKDQLNDDTYCFQPHPSRLTVPLISERSDKFPVVFSWNLYNQCVTCYQRKITI